MPETPPIEAWRLVKETVETEIARLNRLGGEAFAQGDLDRVERLTAEVRNLQAGLAALRRLQSRIEDLTTKTQPGLTVQRKSRGSAKEEPTEAVQGHSLVEVEAAPVVAATLEPATVQNRRARLKRSVATYQNAVSDLLELEDWTVGQWANAKELVCRGRGLIVDSVESGLEDETLRACVEAIAKKMRGLDPDSSFFGVTMARSHPATVWNDVADSLALFPAAYDAIAWLETFPPIDDERFKELLLGASAIETWFYRLMDLHGLRAWDEQQRELNNRVRAVSEERQIYVPWWNRDQKHFVETPGVAAAAQALPKAFKLVFDTVNKSSAKTAAGSVLDKVLDSDSGTDDFSAGLVSALESVFETGLAPSDKKLRTRTAPYRAFLEGASHPQVRKLAEYLKQDAMKEFASGKRVVEAEPEAPDDPEYQRALQAVRAALAGKTVLFVGGNKGQAWRAAQYKQELGLGDLVWPDAEDKTNPGSFSTEIQKADLAVLLVRWSRHSFKSVLDEAKAAGKDTMILTRGLGLHTFVQAYVEQLGAAQTAKPS